jgi:hypothetical protein
MSMSHAHDRPRILLQLDADPQPSVFDAVVALDAGVEQVLRHAAVKPSEVPNLVYGAVFTRGPEDLRHTAIFIGGSQVDAAEELLRKVAGTFFGPFRVSVMLDPNGANTTAAAAVLSAARHVRLAETTALVLGASGPVGQRVARLLARQGAAVRAASRSLDRAQSVCAAVGARVPQARVSPWTIDPETERPAALEGVNLLIAAGAAGVRLLSASRRQAAAQLQAAIDLNAVEPVGLEGIEPSDKGILRDGTVSYGALGIGSAKMKIHKAALGRLFESNDQIIDAEEMLALGQRLTEKRE